MRFAILTYPTNYHVHWRTAHTLNTLMAISSLWCCTEQRWLVGWWRRKTRCPTEPIIYRHEIHKIRTVCTPKIALMKRMHTLRIVLIQSLRPITSHFRLIVKKNTVPGWQQHTRHYIKKARARTHSQSHTVFLLLLALLPVSVYRPSLNWTN